MATADIMSTRDDDVHVRVGDGDPFSQDGVSQPSFLRDDIPPSVDNIRFLADECCGGLAHKMRCLGYDVERCETKFTQRGNGLIRAKESQRVFITTDSSVPIQQRKLFTPIPYVMVEGQCDPFKQLFQVMQACDLHYDERRVFMVCLLCNLELVKVPKEDIQHKIRPEEYDSAPPQFLKCQSCERVYRYMKHRSMFIQHMKEMAQTHGFDLKGHTIWEEEDDKAAQHDDHGDGHYHREVIHNNT
eukprot:TRINITY_DN4371_c0_g1_i1.p1 TRINITY_DN4371_c0_g1~~TRINITY_DN4371_c0_g1_i1.p1  ORF type:complete len:261 (-),score=50.94 TRINITY_DN4371_c0_g1_i1:58-789(-)